MRLLFINQYYAPDYAATAQFLSDCCEHLAAQGHEVHVLTGSALYDGRELELAEEEVLNGVHVHRVRIGQKRRERIRERLWGYLGFYWRAFVRANGLPRPDIVITLTTPPMISLLGAWMRYIRGARFVYWVMDIYPDIAIRAGVINAAGPIRAMWSALGRTSYAMADRVVVLGSHMKEIVCGKRVRRDKVAVIPCWACGREIHPLPEEENAFRREVVDKDAFTLMYSGNMGVCHDFNAVIEGIRHFVPRDGVEFVFIGGGKQEPFLRRELARHAAIVRFLPYQERCDLAMTLSSADAHLVTLDTRFDGLLVPSKIYGIMAAARAVLFVGSKHNEIADIIRDADCGWVVSPDDPTEFIEAVRWMTTHRDEVEAMGHRARLWFEQHAERDVILSRLTGVLETVARDAGISVELAGAGPGETSGELLPAPPTASRVE